MQILDSHVHLVAPDRSEGIVWPDADSSLYRRHRVQDLVEFHAPHTLQACEVIETSRRSVDDRWLLDTAANDARIAAVVLNLQPDASGFDARLRDAARSAKVVGIRFRPIDDYDLRARCLLDSVSSLELLGKSIEFGAKSAQQREGFVALAAQFTGIHWILDHCGHPPARGRVDPQWQAFIAAAALLPNTACKVTSEFACDDSYWPSLELLRARFGKHRLMFGSNWPVATLSEGHGQAVAQLEKLLAGDAPGFFSANTQAMYRLPIAAADGTSREYR